MTAPITIGLLIIVMLYQDKKSRETYIASNKENPDVDIRNDDPTHVDHRAKAPQVKVLRAFRELVVSDNNKGYIKHITAILTVRD